MNGEAMATNPSGSAPTKTQPAKKFWVGDRTEPITVLESAYGLNKNLLAFLKILKRNELLETVLHSPGLVVYAED